MPISSGIKIIYVMSVLGIRDFFFLSLSFALSLSQHFAANRIKNELIELKDGNNEIYLSLLVKIDVWMQ